jgi:hypothetical protein
MALLESFDAAGRRDNSIDYFDLAGVDQCLSDALPCPGITRQIIGSFAVLIRQIAITRYEQIQQITVGAALIQRQFTGANDPVIRIPEI